MSVAGDLATLSAQEPGGNGVGILMGGVACDTNAAAPISFAVGVDETLISDPISGCGRTCPLAAPGVMTGAAVDSGGVGRQQWVQNYCQQGLQCYSQR